MIYKLHKLINPKSSLQFLPVHRQHTQVLYSFGGIIIPPQRLEKTRNNHGPAGEMRRKEGHGKSGVWYQMTNPPEALRKLEEKTLGGKQRKHPKPFW